MKPKEGRGRTEDVLRGAGDAVERVLKRNRVVMTMGGEPTWVPVHPEGPEWHHTAVGPTKLRYARAFADALRRGGLSGAVAVLAPGKQYAGEPNPRWALRLVWRRDGGLLAPRAVSGAGAWDDRTLDALAARFRRTLGVAFPWMRARDPVNPEARVRVLPLDWQEGRWVAPRWRIQQPLELIDTEGPSGLRLPLQNLPAKAVRRALVLELREGALHLFIPPYLEAGFVALLEAFERALPQGEPLGIVHFEGYAPPASRTLESVTLASDPGVLEGNLPPCRTWREYRQWLDRMCAAAGAAGMRSFRPLADGAPGGTGGGNHVLFGGPSPDRSPFFKRPGWVSAILRYWHRHPSLSYLFTGVYAGPSSQAPRVDESGHDPLELEIACRQLERMAAGDRRTDIAASLRNLLTDRTGNTHRAEIALDKFWEPTAPAGCMGLIEYRAIESLPSAEWMSAVALLWRGLLAMLLERPERRPIRAHGSALHDRWFLPAFLEADLDSVLGDLRRFGVALPGPLFRDIARWRFPLLLKGPGFAVRAAHESWPLVGDSAGGTSRLVDASLRRLEFTAGDAFLRTARITVAGAEPAWVAFPRGRRGFGLRLPALLCASAVHPSITPALPLEVCVRTRGVRKEQVYVLDPGEGRFRDAGTRPAAPVSGRLVPAEAGWVTCDLRLA
jgi:uncharacterized protein (DUF2126 family)